MSGGHFDYNQFIMLEIAEEIDKVIAKFGDEYSQETIEQFKKTSLLLRECYERVRRIDWLISGDDEEETFHTRLSKDLELLKSQIK